MDFMSSPLDDQKRTIATPVVSVVDKPGMVKPHISPPQDLMRGSMDDLFEPIDQQPFDVFAESSPIVLVEDPLTAQVVDVHELPGSDVVLLPEPLAQKVEDSVLQGHWHDAQKLSLETFKEVVATDVDNVWVVAYVDPRCRDCLTLSIEWERLTQIEEKVKRKVKLGYVDISVSDNWQIVQDHTKGKKITHTPAVTLYGDNKESPYFYDGEEHPSAAGVHSWVSSYADHFGYGYWDPEHYQGTSAIPNCMFTDEGCPIDRR